MEMDACKEERLPDRCSGNDASVRHQGGDSLAPPAFLIMHEFGRWQGLGKGPYRPVSVVQVELRGYVGEIEVGGPIGVERSHVAPVARSLSIGAHAGSREMMRNRVSVAHDIGDDVLAEIVGGIGISSIAPQLIDEERRIEDIDT